MKEIALIIHGENVTKIELPEGFMPCKAIDKSAHKCSTGCPFSYDDWMGTNCVFDVSGIECPFGGR